MCLTQATKHRPRHSGDRLIDGRYEPIAIEELADGTLQGYSAALNIHLRWEQGRLAWHDPATGRHIATFEGERARADREAEGRIAEREARIEETEARSTAEAERNAEREARLRAEERAENEREDRMAEQRRAEARIRELEEENQRLRGG